MSQVQKVVGVHCGPFVVLAVPLDVVASNELLIKEDDDSLVSLANDGTAKAKGEILSPGGVDCEHTVTHSEVLTGLVREGRRPEREVLLVQKVRLQILRRLAFQLDGLVLLLDVSALRLELLHQLKVNSIEADFDVRQV